MVARWLLRGVCAALLAVCVAAWAGSYWEFGGVLRSGHDRYQVLLINDGWILAIDGGRSTWVEGLRVWLHGRATSLEEEYRGTPHHLAGFGYQGPNEQNAFTFAAYVPMWFPTVLGVGLGWLVWRKTRAKYNGKGFPVEVARK